MRDLWTSDLHGGSPKGLPSSKFACLNYFGRWFWRMCWWFNKMCTLGSRGYFFLIDTDGSRRSRFNEARSAEEKELLISTREHVYFILGILRTDLWNQRTKCVVCQKKKKKTLTCSPQKRSRPALTYQELLSNFIFPLYLENSARICSACRTAQTSWKYKESAETFVDVSKHFQPSLFWNGKGTPILKKISLQISASGLEVRKSQCSVHQWINNMFYNFPGTFKLQN